MLFYTCDKCNAQLKVEENDSNPGSCGMEGIYCPNCKGFVTKIFTSGRPEVYIMNKQDS